MAGHRRAAPLLLWLGLWLAACAGGGSGGSGGTGSGEGGGLSEVVELSDPDPLADPQPAADFLTGEFAANWGLASIGAEQAYAQGAYGSGITVAVVDSGIDTDHPDLDDNISPNSIDIVDPGMTLVDEDGHGTAVAGVIAAERNDTDTHGVAFGATILAIRADDHCGTPPCVLYYSDLARAVDYAVDSEAHVVNMSLAGDSPPSAPLQTALERAAASGVVIVASAGNSKRPNPEYPAASATDPGLAGLLLAVAAVDDKDKIAKFSSRCGTAQNYCLAAPGVDIVTAQAGGGTTTVSGTSFSAPHVSGAIALLLQLFPNLTAKEVVQILLASATDVGPPGVDQIYGHGLLDLDTAAAPLGTLAVPLGASSSGALSDLDATSLALGPAFGDALAGQASLARAIALDDFDRPYRVDLRSAVQASEPSLDLDDLLAFDQTRRQALSLPGGYRATLAFEEPAARASGLGDAETLDRPGVPAFRSLDLVAPVAETGRLRLGHGTTAAWLPGFTSEASGGAPFWRTGELLDASSLLLADGTGVALDLDLPAGSGLSLGWFDSPGDEVGRGSLGRVALHGRLGPSLELGAAASFLDESDGFLGSQSDGAFGADPSARSLFVSLSGRLALSPGIDLFGGYTLAGTRLDTGSDALLGRWDTVLADAFAAGIVWRPVTGERLGLMIGQPLRVFRAGADLRVPTAMNADETIVWSEQRVDATPSGREIDLQLAYDRAVSPRFDLGAWFLGRLEPGHDRAAEPDFGAGVKASLTF